MSDEDLINRSAALSRAAPREWAEFLAAFSARVDERRRQLVAAPSADLQVAQGRAQESSALLDLFSNAVKSADRIAARRSNSTR